MPYKFLWKVLLNFIINLDILFDNYIFFSPMILMKSKIVAKKLKYNMADDH